MPDSEQTYSDYLPVTDAQGDSEGENRFSSAPIHTGSGKTRVFILLLVLAVFAVLAFYASRWKNDVVVTNVVIEGVSGIVAKDFVSRLLDYKGRNLIDVDVNELKAKVMQFPYVREAIISKELNGIVRIRLVERVPVALTDMDGRTMAIDTEGFIVPGKKELSGQIPKLLEVSGLTRLKTTEYGLQQLDKRDVEVLRQFLEALSETAYASLLIRELHFAGNNMTYCIAVQAPTRFIVGNDGNFKEKLKKFEIFWQKVVSKKSFGVFETVDLRFRDRIFTKDTVPSQVTQHSPL
ncbi:MAG: FtsQ-type POTRA domain-containing protein [Chlorobium sp.]|jgi:cell division protein FtsQ